MVQQKAVHSDALKVDLKAVRMVSKMAVSWVACLDSLLAALRVATSAERLAAERDALMVVLTEPRLVYNLAAK